MDEDVVHALDDAVSVHPGVDAVGVGPVTLDPDAAVARYRGLRDLHGPRNGRRSLLCCRNGFGLLDNDDGLTADVLFGPVLGLDDDVVRAALRNDGARRGLSAPRVSGVADVEFNLRSPIACCVDDVGCNRSGQHREHQTRDCGRAPRLN
jgi:hypothetical protein